jgi:hypothetical protein
MRLDRRRSLRLAGCALALCASAACAQRLDAKFDADPLGAPPTSAPAPTPPNDTLVWRTTFASPAVVANPAGGNWVRVTPTQAHLVSPDDRRVFLIANTEPIKSAAGPRLRGSLHVRLDGLGTVGIGFRPVQGGSPLDYLGGVEESNFLPPAGGGVHALRPFSGAMLTGFQSLPGNAPLGGYTAGNVVEINWTIDQSTRTFSASVLGGPPISGVFPAVSGNLATTPMTSLQVVLWLQRPTAGTVAFVDNMLVEEAS